ncbi:MAG: glycoside hydrolase [Thermoguttaceae bacterium]
MKQIFSQTVVLFSFVIFFLIVLSGFTILGEEVNLSEVNWSLKKGNVWAKNPESIKQNQEKDGVIHIEHTGEKDWALSEGVRIPVKPGDVFEMNAKLKKTGGSVSIAVITRKAKGETILWSYAQKDCAEDGDWILCTSKFMVPFGVETIEPRVMGYSPSSVWIESFTLKKTNESKLVSVDDAPVILENQFLKVELIPATGLFAITDKRTKRTWTQATSSAKVIAIPSKTGAKSSIRLINTETMTEFAATLHIEPNRPELVLRLEGEGELSGSVAYPNPFQSKPGDRLIIPMNEGISYPVEMRDIKIQRLVGYGGHGICMAFWGQIEDANGSGMMAILETPDDIAIDIKRHDSELLQVNALWEPSCGQFGYTRSIRFVFFDEGAHVAICKRYREYAKEIGLFKPFTEKVKENPNIDLLLGAANIWYWNNDRMKIVREMKELGMDKLLWSGGGSGDDIAAMNKLGGVLTSRYDIYQDIMDPARFNEVAYVHGDWTTDAWPHDINWSKSDGTWRKGWEVEQKDKSKPRIPCAVICDSKAVPYAKKRIAEELKTKPFTARFIDTTVAAPWFECYNPDHPMTRSDSRRHKMELLKTICDFKLVCGSETGHDASVPFCDFYEGMLSLGPYRVHESGRNMIQVIEDVPPQIIEFQLNSALRLPLWELVYHDCVVAQWYWGDYNNKLPKVWKERDLFNVLYGTPPMYMFTQENWNANKEKFAASYKVATETAKKGAYSEMTDHKILSPDRLVQQTVFSNGLVATVNFSDKSFTLKNGETIPAKSAKVTGGQKLTK